MPNMLEFLRLRACPTCQWNLPGGHTEPELDCPVCRGKPVTCMVIWNEAYRLSFATLEHVLPVLPRNVIEGVVAFAPRLALDLLFRPPGARGAIVEAARAEAVHARINVTTCGACPYVFPETVEREGRYVESWVCRAPSIQSVDVGGFVRAATRASACPLGELTEVYTWP